MISRLLYRWRYNRFLRSVERAANQLIEAKRLEWVETPTGPILREVQYDDD